MKKAMLLILVIASLSGCKNSKDKICLFLYNHNDPYIRDFASLIVENGYDNYEIEIFDCQNSQIIQNELIEEQLKENPVLMIINPVDRLGAYTIIKKLESLNIPVIFFNREPLEQDLELWDKAYYVGANAVQSGKMQAHMIMELFGNDPENLNKYDRNGNGSIETVILKGEQGHQDAEIRTTEVVETFTSNGYKIQLLVTEVANWNRYEAYEKMKLVLEKYDNIELVISNNDAMALGAISIMRQWGIFNDTNSNNIIDKNDMKWIPVVGIDGLDEAESMIANGYLYGTVINDSLSQAKAINELANAIINNQDTSSISFHLEDGKYIWIDYKVLK